jgi:hypothetical protein
MGAKVKRGRKDKGKLTTERGRAQREEKKWV